MAHLPWNVAFSRPPAGDRRWAGFQVLGLSLRGDGEL
jgi:hypothetical protein